MAKRNIKDVSLEQAQAIQLLRLHNPELTFQGFAYVATTTPAHTANNAWIAVETGTIFGIAATKGQVIVDNGVGFDVENIVLNHKTVLTQNIEQNAIRSGNLFDSSQIIPSVFVNWNNGVLTHNTEYNSSKFIGVEPSQNYYCSGFYGFFNDKFEFISGGSSGGGISTPPNAKYIIFSIAVAETGDAYIVKQSASPAQIPDTMYRLNGLRITNGNIDDTLAIAEKNTAFFQLKKNLFNFNAITEGFFINGATGLLQGNSGYVVSDFIPVDGDTSYILSGDGITPYHAWYDSNKSYISGSNSEYASLSPSGAGFLRISMLAGTSENIQLEEGSTSTSYEAFGYEFQKEYKDITELNASFYERTRNLFDKSKITPGYFVNWNNGLLVSNTIYDSSDFIPVDENSNYYFSGDYVLYLAWYDSSKVYISGLSSGTLPITSPENSAFLRFTIHENKSESIQLEKSSSFTYFEPYYRLKSDRESNKWLGKLLSTMGDSITNGETWQGYVYRDHGLRFKNYGEGGTKITGSDSTAMNNDARINAIDVDSDIVMVMGGVNDWFNNVPLGLITSSDITEFYGALNVMCQKLSTRFPEKTIILATPTYCLIGTTQNEASSKNTIGLTCSDYGNAVILAGKKWGIPVVDTLSSCGWNYVNINTYIRGDDGNYLHPNDTGGRRIASVISGFIKTIMPPL
jgi:hypothetical protein